MTEDARHHTVTELLEAARDGSPAAADALLPIVYDELRRLAAAYLRHERPDHTLQPTALVHDAYLRLIEHDEAKFANRRHFFALAARVMRNVLVDHARGKQRQKRGGGDEWQRITLSRLAAEGGEEAGMLDLIALDRALERLSSLDERKARLVELRFFAGLSLEETAEVLGIARSTASEEWRMARAWLYRELADE